MGIEKVYDYYRRIASENEETIRHLQRRMNLLGGIRLILVAAWIATLILLNQPGATRITLITLAFAAPFVALMLWHDRLSARKKYTTARTELCRAELKGLDYDFSAFDGQPAKTDPDHPFSFDLDLFGDNSLFQSLNRTVTHGGTEHLADWFLNPCRELQTIRKRQDGISELSRKEEMRQNFCVTGKLSNGEKSDAELLDSLAGNSFPFARKRGWKIMVWLIPALWLLVGTAFFTGIIGGTVPIVFFIVSTFLAYSKTKQINAVHASVDRMEKRLSVYSRLIRIVEENKFESDILKEIQGKLAPGEEKIPASQAVKQLSRMLGALDQRGNLIVGIINIFILRDIRIAIRLERWKQTHRSGIGLWFDALAGFDALCSLGTFAFNHPDYTRPELTPEYFVLEGKALGHPLMHRDSCVRNDVSFRDPPSFMIVTGANMAGKSTYLRTVGVNFLLACTGAPVCARELTLCPAGLVTSLRTSDSLTRNESYFFAELKRLKAIIDRLKAGEKLFIILDEILKGTNSADKQKGSMALIRQFLSCGTCGIIATHDLVLGTLAGEFPGAVRNYRFEGVIQNDRLSFSYTLQQGVAQNMNATFLMEKMGITVGPVPGC